MKKRVNGAWVEKSPPKYGTSTDTITTLPADIMADGTSASVNIKGKLTQSGTPSPQNPIYPSEVGNKTANLFDKDNTTVYNAYFGIDSESSIWITSDDSRSVKIACKPNTQYTLSCLSQIPIFRICSSSNVDITPSNMGVRVRTIIRSENTTFYTFTTSVDDACIIFQGSASLFDTWLNNLMLVEGSTAPTTYIPYGYKIPILSANTTTPVYLGEVQSTRQIKKLVLTGQESNWRITGTGRLAVEVPVDGIMGQYCACSHYKGTNATSLASLNDKECEVGTLNSSNKQEFVVYDTDYSTTADFKTYLQQQYAAGTPVTVWYVLATPTTGIVNEPIRKIGTYSDSVVVSGVPTIAGSQTFDVDTTLKPSEVDLTYHGWHRKEPKERVNGDWE